LQIIDSHTGGEPTRVLVSGGPDLRRGSLATRLERMRTKFDHFRTALVNEPRGCDVVVGAMLVEPEDPSCSAGVIFFNNVGYLGMCGHGTIGLVATLAHLGRLQAGVHRIDTPVGAVTARLRPDGEVEVDNVESWRAHRALQVEVPGIGTVTGDIAWSGNWFFLVQEHGQELALARVDELSAWCWQVRMALNAQGFAQVDHIELFGASTEPGVDSRSFVLCPGKAYDRSPCGTGTSGKLACMAAEGKLEEAEVWVQESIIGSRFRASFRWLDRSKGRILPTIIGRAHVNAESSFLIDDADPFRWGIA
jgi:4-hydroxyproline epimerase